MHLNWMRADLHLSKVAFVGASLTAGGFTAALSGVRIGLSVVKTGLHAMWVALGPIGWAVLGLIAIYEAWTNNLFGVQEGVAALNEFLHEMWEHLKQTSVQVMALVAIYERIFPPALEDATKATDDFNEANKESEKTSKKLLSLEKERQRQIESGTATDLQQKILLEEIVQAKEKDAEAQAKLLEAASALDDVNVKHNTRLAEVIPLEKEIHRLNQQKQRDAENLTLLETAGNGQTLEAIQLREDLVLAEQNLLTIETQLAKALQGTLTVQEAVNDAVSQGGDDMTAYGEVVYDTAGNIVTLDNSLVSAGNTIEGIITPTGTLTGAFSGLNGELGRTGGFIESFNEMLTGAGVTQLEAEVTALKQTLIDAKLEGIDPLSPAFIQAKDAIMPAIESLSGRLYDTFGEERMNEFGDSMKGFGIVTIGEFDKIGKSVSDVGDKIDEVKKNYDDLMRQTGGLTQATGNNKNPQQKRKGLIPQSQFDALPYHLRGNYRLQSGSVGLPTHLRDAISKRKSDSLQPKSLLIQALNNLPMGRTGAKKFRASGQAKHLPILREYLKRGFDKDILFDAIRYGSGGAGAAVAKKAIAQQDAEIEAARIQSNREREFSVLFLGLGLGYDRQEIRDFSESEEALYGFEERTIKKTGISSQQFQNFIKTHSGRQDLSNLLAHQQREEFLAALV